MEERAEGSSNQGGGSHYDLLSLHRYGTYSEGCVYAGVCETYIVHVDMYGMKYNTVTEECTLLSVTCNN